MKDRTIQIKSIGALMLMAIFALAITSCQKSSLLEPGIAPDNSVSVLEKAITPPDVPDIIKVPQGNKAIWHTYASGFQIYEVTQSTTDPDVYLWTFIEPAATLYSNAAFSKAVGTHYAGPTWKATAGPKAGQFVVGTKLQGVTQDATAIQWLLLQAVPNTDPDYYSQITFIQRVNTTGGLAPTTGADAEHLGVQESVPYTAEYYFYTAK